MSLRDYLFHEEPGITLYCGDCREVLPLLNREHVNAVVTDPPYGVGLTEKRAVHRGKTRTRPAKYAGFDDTPEYVRDVVVPAIAECRLIVLTVVVTPGTRCLWMYPQPDDLGCWFSPAGTGLGPWGFRCMQPILYYGRDPYIATGARPNSIGQRWPNDANTFNHPCAKPIRFWSWLVARASREGQTVLDPFCGSGTTLEVAKNSNRRAIGIEIEPRYCEIAVKRLRQEVLPLAPPSGTQTELR